MKHIFILKQINADEHPFISVIHEVMKGYDYEIKISKYTHHCDKMIEKYIEKTRFYGVGGDGFMNQMIQKLVHTDHELVVIPYGTGNDFSRTINSHQDAKKVLIDSLKLQAQKVDIMKVNDMYALNSICFGLDSVIANTVHEYSVKPTHDSKSYVKSIMGNLAKYKFNLLKIENENFSCTGPVTLFTINNGRYYGGGFEITPHAKVNDGLMDVLLLKKINRLNTMYYVYRVLSRSMENAKKVLTFQLKTLDVYGDIACNVDGEVLHDTYFHVEIIPLSLNIVSKQI